MELSQWKQQLDTWFAHREPEMLALLETLVGMDSFSNDGQDVNKVGEVIVGHLRQWGFHTAMLPKRPVPSDEAWMSTLGNVFTARTHAMDAGPGVIFLGHMDTVYPAGTTAAWPFRLDRAADKATGPGVLDMKGGLVLNIFAARALKELGIMNVPMTLTFSPDEELGSPTTTPLLGEQLNGGHAALCTEPGYPGGGVTVERKGSGHMVLDIQGKSAHAGRNYEDGASAILELAHKILACNQYVNLEEGATVNTGIVEGGTSANSIAPHAKARIHFTFRTLDMGRHLENALRTEAARTWITGTSSRISGGIRLYPLPRTPKVQALWELVRQAGEALNYPQECHSTKGAAESGYCVSVLDLPALCSMGPEGKYLHSPEEYIIPSTLIPRAKLLALTALQASRTFTASPKVVL